MTFKRRQGREWAIQMLTAVDLNPTDDIDGFISCFWGVLSSMDESDGGVKVEGPMIKFAEERVRGVLGSLTQIDNILSNHLENWDLYRLGTVERAVLRLGVWEMKNTDIPKAVVINEAIDLTNWFSTPKSRVLVNGVLDKCSKAI